MRLPTAAWAREGGSRNLRRGAAALLTAVSVAMLAGAVWLFAFPFYTDVRARTVQKTLRVELASSTSKTAYENRQLPEGKPVTRIVIPRLKLDGVVVQGTSEKALNAGMGHYSETPLPGEAGNVAIAGHRTMNGKAFGDLDKLRPGDRVELVTPLAKHVYEVTAPFDGHPNPWVTTANDWSVVNQSDGRWLTLTTCHPRGSSKQRLIARAALVATEPVA